MSSSRKVTEHLKTHGSFNKNLGNDYYTRKFDSSINSIHFIRALQECDDSVTLKIGINLSTNSEADLNDVFTKYSVDKSPENQKSLFFVDKITNRYRGFISIQAGSLLEMRDDDRITHVENCTKLQQLKKASQGNTAERDQPLDLRQPAPKKQRKSMPPEKVVIGITQPEETGARMTKK